MAESIVEMRNHLGKALMPLDKHFFFRRGFFQIGNQTILSAQYFEEIPFDGPPRPCGGEERFQLTKFFEWKLVNCPRVRLWYGTYMCIRYNHIISERGYERFFKAFVVTPLVGKDLLCSMEKMRFYHSGSIYHNYRGKFCEVFNLAIWESGKKIAKFNSANIKPRGASQLAQVLQEKCICTLSSIVTDFRV